MFKTEDSGARHMLRSANAELAPERYVTLLVQIEFGAPRPRYPGSNEYQARCSSGRPSREEPSYESLKLGHDRYGFNGVGC
jgi:hypothetical protein